VYFVAKDNITLKNVVTTLKVKRIQADPGSDSSKRGIIGIPGEDKIIPVPCGVTVYDENNVLLGEHNYHNVIIYVFHRFLFLFYNFLFIFLLL